MSEGSSYPAGKTGRKNKKHGMSRTRLYRIWKGMIFRCSDPKTNGYRYYGGKGIRVCERWYDLENFVADMSPGYRAGLTLDRIDPDGNYEPGNCRWATTKEQSVNRTNTVSFTHDGVTLCAPDWADRLGVSRPVFITRATKWGLREAVLRTIAIPENLRADKRFLRGDGPSHKGMATEVAEQVIELGLNSDLTNREIATQLGIGYYSVFDILNGKSWLRVRPELPRPIRRGGKVVR